MNLQKLRDLFRSSIRDTKKPYLVSDPEADEFANDAQVEACRRARLMVDSTSDLAQPSITQGDPLVPKDSRIISLRVACLQSTRTPLRKRTVRMMDEEFPGWRTNANQSRPLAIVVDYDKDYYFLYPVPNASDTLLTTVTREPLAEMVDDEDEPEIPTRYHGSLVHWMKKRAYSLPDADLFNVDYAKAAEAEFSAEFGPAPSALDEQWEFEHYDDVGER